MGSQQNRDASGRISKVLNTLHQISEAFSSSSSKMVGAQTDIVEDMNRIDSIVSAIESSVSELHDLVVPEKKDKDTSKDSGNTSFTDVRCVVKFTLQINCRLYV